MTTRGTISAIAAKDPEVADAIFGKPTSIALGGWPGSTHGKSWASQVQFAADLEAGNIPPEVRAVMYDPEAWDATPIPEQRDPITHIREFVRLAHQHGYFAMVTPHPRLVEVPGATCRKKHPETREDAYLRCRISTETARVADAYETQGQRLQRDPGSYREFISKAATRAREANRNVVVLSGLSTHPGYAATPEMLHAAWKNVSDVVDGHYLSLARVRLPAVAAQFLRLVVNRGG